MRRTLLAALSAAAVTSTFALVSTPADAADVQAHIPFSFEVHGSTLPPGDYTFSVQPNILFVRGYHNSAFAITVNEESATDEDAKVVFEHEGDQYILRDVWTGGGSGRELLQPRVKGERGRTAEDGSGAERIAIPAL
jgi:hypothetical protein